MRFDLAIVEQALLPGTSVAGAGVGRVRQTVVRLHATAPPP
jgi:hypothetical protein